MGGVRRPKYITALRKGLFFCFARQLELTFGPNPDAEINPSAGGGGGYGRRVGLWALHISATERLQVRASGKKRRKQLRKMWPAGAAWGSASSQDPAEAPVIRVAHHHPSLSLSLSPPPNTSEVILCLSSGLFMPPVPRSGAQPLLPQLTFGSSQGLMLPRHRPADNTSDPHLAPPSAHVGARGGK